MWEISTRRTKKLFWGGKRNKFILLLNAIKTLLGKNKIVIETI